MLNRFLFIICGLALLTGCQQQPAAGPLAYGPDVNTIVVTDNFASQAIAATGGYEAWINTKKLELDCVVTFYNSDGSFYLTEQHHEIYPWSNSIRISAVEPQGKFTWLLSQDSFSAESPAQPQVQYDIRNAIYAVRDITMAPVRLLDKSVNFVKDGPVKMEGLWYYPIRCSRVTPAPSGVEGSDERRETVFYQSRDTSLIDITRFTSPGHSVIASEAQPSVAIPISLMVRGYDYRKVKKAGLLLPTKIEVFETNTAGVIQRRLLKIEYHD